MRVIFRSLLFPLTMVLLLSLSDCIRFGSDLVEDEIGSSPFPTSTPEPTATPEATPRPGSTVTPTPTPTPPPASSTTLTEETLERFLLQLDDLSPLWSDVDVDAPITEIPGASDIDGTLVSAFYQRNDLGPYFVHMLFYAEDENDTETAFEAIEAELESATILDGVTDEVRSWQTEPSTFESLGDETFAFKAIGDTGLIPVEADLVTTRKGQFISFIIHAELMEVDTELTEELAGTAVERLPDSAVNPDELTSIHAESARNVWNNALRHALGNGNHVPVE